MNILIISISVRSLCNFRASLIRDLHLRDHNVFLAAPGLVSSDLIDSTFADIPISCLNIPISRNVFNILEFFTLFFTLSKFILRHDINIVLPYSTQPNLFAGLCFFVYRLLPQFKSILFVPLVTGLGGVIVQSRSTNKLLPLKQSFIYFLLRLSFVPSSKVIFQNLYDRDFFLSCHILSPTVPTLRVFGSGVDVKLFKPLALPSSQSFLMVSRLIRSKGVYDFVEAARMLRSVYPNSCFYLAGRLDIYCSDSISESDLQYWIDSGLITYLGYQNDVKDAFKLCRYFVLPSYYREGVPRSAIEALAFGRPVITTAMPGCEDTVIDNTNGYLVPPNDPVSLFNAMRSLTLKSDQQVNHMAQSSVALALTRFNVSLINDQIISFLSE